MKSMKKTIAALVAISMIFGCVIGGTLAWLTAQSGEVKNVFTTSDINVTLTETDSDDAGTDANNNSYKMVPGWTIAKDPVVTVKSGSEACYLFVKVEESSVLKDYITYTIETGTDKWQPLPNVTGVYYREVAAAAVDQPFAVLTDNKVTVKGSVTKQMMAALQEESATQPTLTFTAYASQLYKDTNVKFDVAEAWHNISDPEDKIAYTTEQQ